MKIYFFVQFSQIDFKLIPRYKKITVLFRFVHYLEFSKKSKIKFRHIIMGTNFLYYNYFLNTILTPRFVLLEGRTFRKLPNSCRFAVLKVVLLDEYHSSKIT